MNIVISGIEIGFGISGLELEMKSPELELELKLIVISIIKSPQSGVRFCVRRNDFCFSRQNRLS